MLPPTSILPPIKKIHTSSVSDLRRGVEYIRTIYNPPVRGTTRRRRRRRSSSSNAVPATLPKQEQETAAAAGQGQDKGLTRLAALETLRNDTFERGYVVTWLTALLSHYSSPEERAHAQSTAEDEAEAEDAPDPDLESLFTEATALLALCAGTAAAGTITRTFTFPLPSSPLSPLDPLSSHSPFSPLGSPAPAPSISVLLKDAPLDNRDYGSVGAQTWGGACVLAQMVVEEPARFGLDFGFECKRERERSSNGNSNGDRDGKSDDAPPRTFRVLELGAGTGLVSLTIAKLALAQQQVLPKGNVRVEVEVVATDYYPSVLANLQRNIAANGFSGGGSESTPGSTPGSNGSGSAAGEDEGVGMGGVRLTHHALDWSMFAQGPLPQVPQAEDQYVQKVDTGSTHSTPLDESFDALFGADIVYEPQHALWIKACVAKLLRRPSAKSSSQQRCQRQPWFHLIIPLRSTHAFESGTIETVFGEGERPAEEERQGERLVIHSKEIITCDAESGSGREELVEYAYYKIGWSS